MRLLVNVAFNIYKPNSEEMEILKSCNVWFKTINEDMIQITDQKIDLDPETMEKVLDVFVLNGATVLMHRYETERYDFAGKGVEI